MEKTEIEKEIKAKLFYKKTRGEILHSPLINIISFSVIPKSTAMKKTKKAILSTKLCESRLMRGDCVEKFSFFDPKAYMDTPRGRKRK